MVGIVGGGGIGAHAVHRLPALRLRLRARHPARHHRADHDRRDRLGLDAEAVPMSAPAPRRTRGRLAAPLAALHAAPSGSLRSAFYRRWCCIAVVWSLRTIEIIPEFLYDAPAADRRPVRAHVADRLGLVSEGRARGADRDAAHRDARHHAGGRTGEPGGAAGRRATSRARSSLNTIGRFILVATRSVNSLIWALFFVAVFGPGALAGTLAIALRSIGFTGKCSPRRSRRRSPARSRR